MSTTGSHVEGLYRQVLETLVDGASLEELGHWGCVLGGYNLSSALFSSLFPGYHEVAASSATNSYLQDVLPHHRLNAKDPVDHGLKPMKL
jgi:hypothetical protein